MTAITHRAVAATGTELRGAVYGASVRRVSCVRFRAEVPVSLQPAPVFTMRRSLLLLSLAALPLAGAGAQQSEEERYRRFLEQQERQFNQFMTAQDSAFANFLERDWRAMQAFAASQGYTAPKPRTLPRRTPTPAPTPGPRPAPTRPTPAGGNTPPANTPRANTPPVPAAPPDNVVANIPALPPMPPRRTTGTPGNRPAPLALIPPASRPLPARPVDPSMLPPEPAPAPTPAPRPAAPAQTLSVPFYGGPIPLRYTRSPLPALGSPVDGKAIADFYRGLASADWGVLAEDLRAQSEALALDDYAYAQFVLRLGRQLAGDESRARLLTWYLLLKSNVDARVGYIGPNGATAAMPVGTIVLLVPSTVMVYNTTYFTLQNEKFFAVSLDEAPSPDGLGRLFTYDGNYPGQPRKMDMRIARTPNLGVAAESRTLRWSYKDSTHTIEVRADRNAVKYLEWFPQVEWDVWFGIQMSQPARETLLPALRRKLQGRSEREQVNFLIRFVQTAFEYKTDGDQFGREKPLSVDETLLYPFSDCEDRSIIFAALVRELTGLEVVGLLYPGHMATAVKFREAVTGDAVMIGGQRWIVSDPTYIGADVGEAMPQFKTVTPQIVRIP